jgi:HAD superfamily hydrolase (TIGR01509 family)
MPPGPLELVIFDCDGVLVDSEAINQRIQAEAFTRLGVPMTAQDVGREFLGMATAKIFATVEARLGRPFPEGWVEALHEEVYAAFERELRPIPGVVEALNRIAVPACVASSGTHEKLRVTLGITGLYERFAGRIFSATEVANGKPAPDLFLHAARSLGVERGGCAVVEDSPMGVAAARAAGMRVFAYAAATAGESLTGPGTVVFTDMRELPGLLAAG